MEEGPALPAAGGLGESRGAGAGPGGGEGAGPSGGGGAGAGAGGGGGAGGARADLRRLQGELQARVGALGRRFEASAGPGLPERADPSTLGPEVREALRRYYALQSSLKVTEAAALANMHGVTEAEVADYFRRLQGQTRRVFEKIERKNVANKGLQPERELGHLLRDLNQELAEYSEVLKECGQLDSPAEGLSLVAFLGRVDNSIIMQRVLGSLLAQPGFLLRRRRVLVQSGLLEVIREWASPVRIADRQTTMLCGILHTISALQLQGAPSEELQGVAGVLEVLRDLREYHRPPVASGAAVLLDALGGLEGPPATGEWRGVAARGAGDSP